MLHRLRPLILSVLLALGMALASPASAVQPTGSAGWINWDSTLYAGPGTAYAAVGDIAGGLKVRVDRCSRLWCQVHASGVSGWVALVDVDFGRGPGGWLSGPVLNYPAGGSGDVCFYTGRNYTGASICVGSGHVVRDLALIGRDNTISSIEIGDGVSVRVCRDRDFHSYCERIIASTPHLSGFLDDGISSWQVY